jgi:hypothetical protein
MHIVVGSPGSDQDREGRRRKATWAQFGGNLSKLVVDIFDRVAAHCTKKNGGERGLAARRYRRRLPGFRPVVVGDVRRRVDLYLDTLYSAFEMIASGITTAQHLHGWLPGDLTAVEAGAGEVIRAYEDIGMRVSYSFALRDQNRLIYQDDKEFTASPPAEL